MVGIHGGANFAEPTLFDVDNVDEDFGLQAERLERLAPCSESNTADHLAAPADQPPPTTHDPYGRLGDPGIVTLVEHLAPRHTDLHFAHRILGPRGSSGAHADTHMMDHPEAASASEKADIRPGLSEFAAQGPNQSGPIETTGHHSATTFDPHELRAKASASLREQEATSQTHDDASDNALEKRHDSHQEQDAPLSSSKQQHGSRHNSPSLKVETSVQANRDEESIATSPNLSKHVLVTAGERGETLPAFQHHSPTGASGAGSPQHAKLPSLNQIVTNHPQQYGHLPELAEAATQSDARTQHYHSPAYSSTTSQSPGIPFHPYPGPAQVSPASQQAFSARSPTGVFGDPYGSPSQYAHGTAYYLSRRSSAPTDRAPALPPSLPSVSSSGESHGPASSIDGYSTAHTTPINPTEASARTLPMPSGMAGFKCDVPECTMPPFQTQYLLNSHKNVHTNLRPHFCPVKDCPRSEGGKGFKRKNEMIRHGLVHESPGYVCPFCPDREHRYPRPDNLQRHVRVHHVDKSRDDPELRAVLAQRTQGTGKTRRRRANTGGSGT